MSSEVSTHGNTNQEAEHRSLRQRMWNSKALRGAIVGFGIALGVLLSIVVTPAPAQASCTDFEKEYGLACDTNPQVRKCVLNISGAGIVGFGFGGPLGFLAGITGAGVSCVVDAVG
jgi:hypothetical protein